jgi:hypothetical protein
VAGLFMNGITRWSRRSTPIRLLDIGPIMDTVRIDAKALAVDVWPAKHMTIYVGTCSRKKTLRLTQTMENGTIVRPTLCDILLGIKSRAVNMPTGHFDPYGQASHEGKEPPRGPSSILERWGRWIFWLLVISVVMARAFYFSGFPHF